MSRTFSIGLVTRTAFLLTLLASPLLAQQQEPTREPEPAQQTEPTATVPRTEMEAELVSVTVLEAQLRPLTKDQVQAELDDWLGLLQEKCAEVSAVEIQAMGWAESGDPSAIDALNERAFDLRAERDHLITRVNTVIDSLAAKGGDVTDARSYVASVVVAPPISGWRAAWATMRAWLTSADGGMALVRNLARAFGIIVVAWLVAGLLGRATRRLLCGTEKVSELLRSFTVTAVRRSILFFGLLVALSQLGLNMGPMLAAIGALGLVIGLALQGTLSNFASGLLMMVYRPFDVGDVVNTAGTLGEVEGMTLVTTTIKTLDNQRLSIPNNMIWGDVIINVTAEKTRRVDLIFGIGYGDDVGKAKKVLMDILKDHEKVLEDPEPNVQVSELGDSSVNFVVRPWVATEDYWDVHWDVTQAVKERFDAEGISIPFPQRDIHVYKEALPASSGTPQRGNEGWIASTGPAAQEHAPTGNESA